MGWYRAVDWYTQSTLNPVLSLSDSFVQTASCLSLCSSEYQGDDTLSINQKLELEKPLGGREGFWAAASLRHGRAPIAATEVGQQRGRFT